MGNTTTFRHNGTIVIICSSKVHGHFGFDWTATYGGVLIAKGWIRGDYVEVHDAIVALLTSTKR